MPSLIMPLNSSLFLKGDQRMATLEQSLLLSCCCHVCSTRLSLNPSTSAATDLLKSQLCIRIICEKLCSVKVTVS